MSMYIPLINFFGDIITNVDDPEQLLTWLVTALENDVKLEQLLRSNTDNVSYHIQSILSTLPRNKVHSARFLPVFFCEGNRCATLDELSQKELIFCPSLSSTLKNGKLGEFCNILSSSNNKQLLVNLNVPYIEESEAYSRHMIKYFDRIPCLDQIWHLNNIINRHGTDGNIERQLKTSCFVRNQEDNKREMAQLFLATNDFQLSICPKSLLLNKSYLEECRKSYSFKQFLTRLGMKTSLESKHIIDFIDSNYVGNKIKEKDRKSRSHFPSQSF